MGSTFIVELRYRRKLFEARCPSQPLGVILTMILAFPTNKHQPLVLALRHCIDCPREQTWMRFYLCPNQIFGVADFPVVLFWIVAPFTNALATVITGASIESDLMLSNSATSTHSKLLNFSRAAKTAGASGDTTYSSWAAFEGHRPRMKKSVGLSMLE